MGRSSLRFVFVMAVLVPLSGCAASHLARATNDNCAPGNKNPTNYIEVFMDDTTRRPRAEPDSCHVQADTTIVWVQSKQPNKRVVIAFDKGDGSADKRGTGTFYSRYDLPKNEQLTTLEGTRAFDPASPTNNVYRYSVSIGGIKSDPSIIIDP